MESAIMAGGFALAGVFLGSFLSYRQIKNQSLLETKRIIYAKLLSNAASEENYPEIHNTTDMYDRAKVENYNKKLKEWRKNRLMIKGMATEALFITQNKKLTDKLSSFIYSKNPDDSILNDDQIQDIMKKEVEIL